MDNTEKARELISKHLYLHGGDGLGITDGHVYRAVLDAVIEALTMTNIVGHSEQFKCGMQLSKSGKRCEKQCVECELTYKNYSI
jgi:hypothetical protein